MFIKNCISGLSMKLLTSVLCLLLLYDQQLCSHTLETEVEQDNPLPVGDDSSRPPIILKDSPRFVVRLADRNLLCYSVEGFELFTYNLITSNYLAINGFLNVSTLSHGDRESDIIRGFTDIGVFIKSVESRSRGGTRMFRHSVYGSKQKVVLERFGEVDMHKGAISFSLEEGHSNIESENSNHEQFRVVMDKPKCDILMISGDGTTFSVYVEDLSGLVGINTHGLIGQFLNSTVRIDTTQSKLIRATGEPVDVEVGIIWDTLQDHVYAVDQKCWYPVEGESIIEGEVWDYIVEHLHALRFKHNLFNIA